MRRSLILFATTMVVAAAPAIEGDAPGGVGTGITKSIAPPDEKIPKECLTDYPGTFGIAVEMAPIWTPFRNTDDSSSMGDMDDLAGMDKMGAQPASPKAASSAKAPKASASAAASMNDGHGGHDMAKAVVSGVMRAPAVDAGPDTTVTVRSTRYTTKTYTVSRLNTGAAIPKPAKFEAGGSGNVIKAAVIRQIGDGQVQVPNKPTEVTLKPTATPFAPLSSGSPRISQIGDGQIQNLAPKSAQAGPTYGAAAAPTTAGGASPAKGPAPAKSVAPAAAPAPAAKPPAPPAPAPAAPMGGMDHGGHNMLVKRQSREVCPKKDTLGLTLKSSVLLDKLNRIGYAAGNMQFQFDNPPQAGALYTSGFSVCSFSDYRDSSKKVEYLGWGNSTDFYACKSGEFSNLYSPRLAKIGPIPGQCYKVKLTIIKFPKSDCS